MTTKNKERRKRKLEGIFGISASESCWEELKWGTSLLQPIRGDKYGGFSILTQGKIRREKCNRLVWPLFKEKEKEKEVGPIFREGKMAIGGVGTDYEQPILRDEAGIEPFSLVGDVKITNREEIREKYPYLSGSDLEICASLASTGKNPVDKLENIFRNVKGRFCLAMQTPEGVFACRDPWGFHPLSIGRNKKEGICAVATESFVLPENEMEIIRETGRGEIVELNSTGFNCLKQILPEKNPERAALCGFEYGYGGAPASIFEDIVIWMVRFNLGRKLAQKYGVGAQAAFGFPLSGNSAAEGCAFESKIPLINVWQYNSQFGRSYLPPLEIERQEKGRGKLSPIEQVIRLFWELLGVDDSIVEGNQMMRRLYKILRLMELYHPGKGKVHLRISCPPKINPCPLETPFRPKEVLFAANNTKEEMRKKLGVESLEFNTLDDFVESVKEAQSEERKKENPLKTEDLCLCCFTGEDLVKKYFE